MQLLLACSRTPLRAIDLEVVASLLQQNLDWEYVERLADRHGVLPLLWQHLHQHFQNAVPPGPAASMEVSVLRSLQRNLKLSAELLRLLRLFREHGIIAIPFKGPVLTISLYGSLTLREFADLDLLLRREDILRARALLHDKGYESPFQLTERQERAYLQSQCEHYLYAPGGLFSVEIHWQIVARFQVFPFDTARWWQRCRSALLHGIEVPDLSHEDELLALCVHGQKHCWSRLIWISDVAQLLAAAPLLPWNKVTEQARELGAERVLWLGLNLARELLHAPLPAHILERIEQDPTVASLTRQVQRNLFREDAWTSERETIWFALCVRERWRDRVRHVLRRTLTSTPLDWSIIRIPDWLFPLYSLLRLVRLAGRVSKGFGSGRPAPNAEQREKAALNVGAGK